MRRCWCSAASGMPAWTPPRGAASTPAISTSAISCAWSIRVLIAHKPEVMTALSPPPRTEAAWNIGQWSQLYREKLHVWLGSGRYTEGEAEWLAWGELQCRWHRLHGERVPASTCAACGEPIADTEALDPGDGTRVHLATAGCLIRYGER